MILILCSPRTGSSLVTKIFADHGVWLGNISNKDNGFGHLTYENVNLNLCVKNIVKSQRVHDEWEYGTPINANAKSLAAVADIVKSINPREPWAYKVSVELAPLFFQFNPKMIFVERDEEQAAQSMVDKGSGRAKTEALDIHRKRMALMQAIQSEHGGEWVDTDELIEGNYKTIKKAVEFVGLTFDPIIVDKSVNPEQWRHKRAHAPEKLAPAPKQAVKKTVKKRRTTKKRAST